MKPLRGCGVALALIISPILASQLMAQDPCAPFGGGFTSGVNEIKLVPVGQGRQADLNAVDGAISMWNSCGGVPDFSRSSGDYSVNVVFWQGANNGVNVPNCGTQCGCYDPPTKTVHVFETNSNWSRDCTQTWDSVIAHELGHELGLDNAQSGCTSCRIMGNTACGPQVLPDDCDEVGPFWYVPDEDGTVPEPDHPCSNPRK